MSSRKTLNPAHYENNSFADEFAEAIKTGTLIKAVPGKSIIDVTREYMQAKKKTTISMRVPVYVIDTAKAQAKKAGVPWTSYVSAILERAMTKPKRSMA